MIQPERISSTANPRIKLARTLRAKKARDEHKLFLCEGIHHVGVAYEAGWQFDGVFYEPSGLISAYGKQLVQQMVDGGLPVFEVSLPVFESIAEKENTLGIIAVVKKRQATLDDLPNKGMLAAMVTPQDPGNVGTILRTLDAIGGAGLVLLDGGVDPFHPGVIRASMGSIFTIPVVSASWGDFHLWSKENNWSIIGTSARGVGLKALDIQGEKRLILFGSEQKGLDFSQSAACDILVSIPMLGKNTSLNISVAAGVILYKIAGLI